ncbi:MAG TPA: CBS domain-containing protein [Thermoanaerobaculia bacterium]|nr:CBS domain-containing protein [Thermoanaerobaculia bacterium]
MANANDRHVRDVMTSNPESVGEKNSLRDVARIMKDRDTGVVPVVDGKKIIGLITDRDIVVRGLAEGKDLGSASVTELMTKQVRSVREDATVNEALELMSSADVRRVAVVNSSDELVGIVSLGDISINTDKDNKVGKTVESISGAPPNN